LNSASFGSPYAPAQTSFGGNRYARSSLYNVSATDTGQAGASGLPSSLIQRVIARESGGNPRAMHAGNYGLMQIRLSTARAMGYTGSAAGLLDPQTNMTYGLRYLAGAYRAAGGNENRAIALYQRGYYYQAKPLLASPLQRRDRAHLDQELLAHQAVDDQERVGRISGTLEQFGKFARAIGHELGDVLRVHEIGREFDEIGEACTLRGERGANIGEDEPALRVEIRRRLAVLVGADLAGNEQKFRRRLHAG
jgi:hypothetical protein